MKQILQYLSCLMLTLATHSVIAQTPAVMGEPLPDFSFTVRHHEAGVKKLSALRGKPVILYFFAKGCVGSFYALPKLDALHKQFKDRITFIAVAADYRDQVEKSYERYRKQFSLQLPVTTDSVVYKQLGLNGYSTLILLDEAGIVRAVTSMLSAEAVGQFLEGKPFFFHNISRQAKKQASESFDPREPALVNGNGGPDSVFLQRSLIAEWKPGMARITLPSVYEHKDPFTDLESISAIGCSLDELYRIAYLGRSMPWAPRDTVAYGNYHFGIVREIRDTTRFAFDYAAGKNMFCYTQLLQPHLRTKENMMRVMQTDLKNCFGYEVSVEVRKMPYLRLVAKPGAAEKLKTKSMAKSKGNNVDGGTFYKVPVSLIIGLINTGVHLSMIDLPLMDETGIEGHIDIKMNAVMTSLEDVTRELRTQGLDIVPGEREMKVVVIRDAMNTLK